MIKVQTLEQLIAEVPVFSGLAPSHLVLVAGCGRNTHSDAGTLLVREGEPADTFFLIRQGIVALEVHDPGHAPLRIETLHDGEILGWSWLFAPYRWRFDGRAIEPCRLVAFDGACLRGKCEKDHELGYQLMSRFAAIVIARLQATRLQLLDVYGHASAPA